MTLKIKVFATLAKKLSEVFSARYPGGLRAGTIVELELPDGSTIEDLLEHLKLGKANGLITFINGRAQSRDFSLSEGDEIGIFPPIGGG
jgi:molybdopterin converting factor small subunit